jgi:hypothetical protein
MWLSRPCHAVASLLSLLTVFLYIKYCFVIVHFGSGVLLQVQLARRCFVSVWHFITILRRCWEDERTIHTIVRFPLSGTLYIWRKQGDHCACREQYTTQSTEAYSHTNTTYNKFSGQRLVEKHS